jgi:hypothetical protein
MEYFPPPCGCGKQASQDKWDSHEESKKVAANVKKEMKYNLLPEAYHDKFDELENDWTEMSNSKFLSEAQKFEAADAKERQKAEKKKEAMKRHTNKEDDSQVSLNRAQKDQNTSNKKRKTQNQSNSSGKQRYCELCKAAGAPEFVYGTHYTNQCNKKEEYERKLSGGMASRSGATKEMRSKDSYRHREAKLMNKIKRLQKKVKKTKKTDDSSVSSMSSDGTNVSY